MLRTKLIKLSAANLAALGLMQSAALAADPAINTSAANAAPMATKPPPSIVPKAGDATAPTSAPAASTSTEQQTEVNGHVQAVPAPGPNNSTAGGVARSQEKNGKSRAYEPAKQNQVNPTQVGNGPILPVRIDNTNAEPITNPKPISDVSLPTMPLRGLIQIDHRLSPFGLDAGCSEEVGLRDVLLNDLARNLDITDAHALTQIQKYTYYAALSKFLPDVLLGYNLYAVDGNAVTPGGFFGGSGVETLHIKGPFTLMDAAFHHTVYQGGAVMFGAIENKHRQNAVKKQQEATINDSLLAAASNYYNLELNESLLEIRIKAVERSEEQLNQNTQLEKSGLATYLDVLQARTQLARDRQALLDQQSARRVAAIQLAHTLNISLSQDLIPAGGMIRKERLISKDMVVADLLKYAVDNRPELKQYDELRKAAKAKIIEAQAPLQPKVQLNGTVYGIGTHLDNLGGLFVLGLGLNWNFGHLGMTDVANINTARWQTREALVQANKEFLSVFDQVRESYANTLTAEQKIEQTNEEQLSAKEELRLARLRLDTGLGTNLDVLTAQRDLTQAYIDQAQAVINFNLTQVQLVHDIGRISVDSLTSGRLISTAGTTD